MVDPTKYASSDEHQKSQIQRIIEEFADELKIMSGKCMDIGCGPGEMTKHMLLPALHPNAIMIGTDIARNMIKHANQVYADQERIEFDVLDIQTKNLPEKYICEFDHIFSFHTLQWCNNIRQAFENIYEMLRPGGTMLMLIPTSHDLFVVLEMLAKDDRFASYTNDNKIEFWPYQHSIQPRKDMTNLLKCIGFEVVHCSHRDANNYDTASIMAIVSAFDKMPHDRVEEFCADFKREYMKRKLICKRISNGQEQTVILDLYKFLVVYAKK